MECVVNTRVCAAADIFPASEKALLQKYRNRKCGWQLVIASLLGQEEFADSGGGYETLQ